MLNIGHYNQRKQICWKEQIEALNEQIEVSQWMLVGRDWGFNMNWHTNISECECLQEQIENKMNEEQQSNGGVSGILSSLDGSEELAGDGQFLKEPPSAWCVPSPVSTSSSILNSKYQ